ncbi:response regulator transcription factor [Roseateles sp.]|uniref:response regulator n=1 Tax=Roseateles sp. TaxID=1971397 RepID=UPI0025E98454|nr:response regulator transcription factor [Roseateles sp.]MBV8037477.1 response regulator transcription factor [Roseateles sp.]
MTRLLLVDDHPVVRAGYQRLLELGGAWRVVAQAGSVDEALDLHRDHQPELTITDLGLPGRGGLELLRHLLERDAGARVLVFSMHEGEAMVRRALAMGARGYVSKSSAPQELLDAVARVMAGRRHLCAGLPAHWLQAAPRDPDGLDALSDREFEVFRLLAEGRTPADCAGTLHLSPKTVSNLQTQIRDKLGLASTAAMAHLALRRGLIGTA